RLFGVQLAFGVGAAVAAIAQQATVVFHLIDDLGATADLHAVTGAECRAQQGRIAERVMAKYAGAGVDDLHLPSGDAQHGAQTELRFGAGKPALAWSEFQHFSARSRTAG